MTDTTLISIFYQLLATIMTVVDNFYLHRKMQVMGLLL
jgi:hypothetical protein